MKISENLKQKCKEILGIEFEGDLISTKSRKDSGGFCWYGVLNDCSVIGSHNTMLECLKSKDLVLYRTKYHSTEIIAN